MEDIRPISRIEHENPIGHCKGSVFAISLIDTFLVLLENFLSIDLLSCSDVTLSVHE